MSDPGAASVHVDSVMGSTRSFNPGPKVGKKKKRRRPQFVFIKAWDEEKHPRGQPDNKGEFAKVPDDPGTTPIPEGHMRLWHYTGTDNIESIKQNGLRVSNAKGDTYGEPNQVWASAGMPDDEMFHNKNMVEFHIDPRQLDIGSPLGGEKATDEEAARQAQFLTERDSNVTVRGDVPPENIIAVHEPWQASLRYLRGNKDYYDKNPDFLNEDTFKDDPDTLRAIRQFKAEQQQSAQPDDTTNNLPSVNDLPALMERLAMRSKDAPAINLAELKVGGKPFFPQSNLNIPREDMPQLGGKPTPGTPSEKLPVNQRGNVDLSAGFMDYLKGKGIATTDDTVPASELKSTQNQLNARTVALLASARQVPGFSMRPTWVSKDGYVIDGTHRWAAALVDHDAEMPIRRADVDIRTALKLAQAYANEQGVKSESLAQSGADKTHELEDTALHNAEATGGFSLHPSTGAPPSRGFMVAIAGHNVEVPDVTDLSDPDQRAIVGRSIRQFVADNAELWQSNPQAYVGGWWDRAHSEFVLDGSENVLDHDQAVKLGTERNQQSIWDVVKGEEIDTGGTGDRAAAGADDTGDGEAVAPEAGGPPPPRLLKATGGWLRARNGRVGGELPRTDREQASAGAGDREAAAADTGRAGHRGRGFFRFFKHDVSGESRDDHGRWTAGPDAEGVRGSGSRSAVGRTARGKREDARDRRPSKDMKDLVQRDVKTAGDLKPGDVVISHRFSGPRYLTIEDTSLDWSGEHGYGETPTSTDERVRVNYVGRRPSGGMVEGSMPATSVLSAPTETDRYTTEYVGSKPEYPRHDIAMLTRPKFRDGVIISRPLLDSGLEADVVRGVSIVERRARVGALNGVVISTDKPQSPNAYAEYQHMNGNNIVINSKWLPPSMPVRWAGPGGPENTFLSLGRSYKTTVDSNFHPARNGYSAITAITVHELGHHLHMAPVFSRNTGPKLNKTLSEIDKDFDYFDYGPVATGGKWNTPFAKTIAKTVSSYATENKKEFMAEAYAEGMLADRPRPMAKLIAKFLNGEEVTEEDISKAKAQWDKVRTKMDAEPVVATFTVKDYDDKVAADEDYRGLHTAPGPDLGDPMHDLGRSVLPKDTYDHQDWYGSGDDRSDSESWAAMRRARGNPDAVIRVYRAVPVGHTHIHAGDWVTPSKSYAEHHAIGNMGEEPAHVIHMDVPAKELWTNGDSYNEWGWHPEVS